METYVSIIIPAYNKEENLPLLLKRLERVLPEIGKPTEVIVIDDGSRDATAEILKKACRRYPWLKAIILRRNFGQSAALTASIDHARSQVLVTMDADLQNDPEDLEDHLCTR